MRTRQLGERQLGGVIGVVVPAMVAAPSSLCDLPIAGVALAGIPIGAFVGFAMAPIVLRSPSLTKPAILSAVVAVLVGIIAYLTAGIVLTGSPPWIYLLFLVPIVGAAFVVGLPVALPIAFVASWVLRRVAGGQESRGR